MALTCAPTGWISPRWVVRVQGAFRGMGIFSMEMSPLPFAVRNAKLHPRDLWPSEKVARLKGHPSPFPVGLPPSSLTCSSRVIEKSN